MTHLGLEEREDERVLRSPSSGEGAHCVKNSETLRRKPLADGARVVNARLLAEWAHEGQVGADGSPYIAHPAAVVALLEQHGEYRQYVIATAWLHDVVAASGMSLRDVALAGGARTARLVALLANRPGYHGTEALSRIFASDTATEVTLAEQIDNLRRQVCSVSREKVILCLDRSRAFCRLARYTPLLHNRFSVRSLRETLLESIRSAELVLDDASRRLSTQNGIFVDHVDHIRAL